MKIDTRSISFRRNFVCSAAVIAAIACLLSPSVGRADDPIAMAPPTWSPQEVTVNSASVFNWSEVPQNQQVTIDRGVFDQGGYQLYDTAGETIVIPFVNNNLYVMEFAKSTNGTMYFVNDGNEPILYVPRGGYLENATVPGARWYPFTPKFHPATPVFLGIAPSWNAYIGMGWYSDMYCHGGYYGSAPFGSGVFIAAPGFSFIIGSASFNDWHTYHGYWKQYGAPYRVGIVDRNIYTRSSNSFWNGGSNHSSGNGFHGGSTSGGGNNGGTRAFQGGTIGSHVTGGRSFQGGGASSGGSHNSGNTNTGVGSSNSNGHSFWGGTSTSGTNHNNGGNSGIPSGSHTFNGGASSTGSGATTAPVSGGSSGGNTRHFNGSGSTGSPGGSAHTSGHSGGSTGTTPRSSGTRGGNSGGQNNGGNGNNDGGHNQH